MQNGNSIVSKNDALTLLEIIGDCLSCNSISDACNVMVKVGSLLDYNNAVYGLAKLDGHGAIIDYQVLNFSYPVEWLELYRKHDFHKKDPIALENFSNYKLQYWADTYDKYQVNKDFIHLSKDFGLLGGFASGVINKSKTESCLLSLAGNLENNSRNSYIINALTPHLHSTFANILNAHNKSKSILQISIREKQVLNWVRHGKTTWDISMILNISERTVKFHIDNVMKKLDAVSRTHAVAIALSEGLIDIA
jgi:LuxR family transcriptional regulator, quorum-sensing system regulator CviR